MGRDEREATPAQNALTGASTSPGDAMRNEPDIAHEMENSDAIQLPDPKGDETSRLQALKADVRDQEDLERDIGIQVGF